VLKREWLQARANTSQQVREYPYFGLTAYATHARVAKAQATRSHRRFRSTSLQPLLGLAAATAATAAHGSAIYFEMTWFRGRSGGGAPRKGSRFFGGLHTPLFRKQASGSAVRAMAASFAVDLDALRRQVCGGK